jgi:hypothetical protein
LALNPAEPRQAAFSYLFNRTYWGQGYATEAMRALFAFGFNELCLHRVADAVDPANVAPFASWKSLVCDGKGIYASHCGTRGAGGMSLFMLSLHMNGKHNG